MEFRILGPLEVTDQGQTVRVTGPRERALLSALLLRAGEAVPADHLIDLLWGDDAPPTPNALQAVVARLRKALGQQGKDLLITRTPGYALAVSHDQVDAIRFQRLIAQARDLPQHDPAAASDLLRQALGLARAGPAGSPANRWPSRKSHGWRSCGWPRSNPASKPSSRWAATAR